MDDAAELSVKPFNAPRQWLSAVDGKSAASLVQAAADVALVIDGQGVIRDLALGGTTGLDFDGSDDWVGRHWLETVTVESRPKVLAMLREAAANEEPATPWRQLNHPMADGADVPVLYAAIALGEGTVVAVGRDLRQAAMLQQRLVDAQQAMERDYLKLRQTEARYRLLFETVAEAVVIVDATTLAVVEANPAAQRFFGDGARRVVGRPFLDLVDATSRGNAAALLAAARSSGRGEDVRVRLGGTDAPEVTLGASLFKAETATLLLLRMAPLGQAAANRSRDGSDAALLRVVEDMPDAFVATDLQGRVLTANRAFADLVQLPAGEVLAGQSLERWLGRSAVDLNVLIGTLKQHGLVRLFPTTLRSAYGAPLQVEISAVSVTQGATPCLGFAIRDVERRLSADTARPREMPRSPGQLAELVGRVPLKDIVGETTDLIERMCIEAALQLTRDNRASAAEMLGLSRQSLYVKLRRYGLGDLGSGDEESTDPSATGSSVS